METYEYHEASDSLERGYIFALFTMRNNSLTEIKSILNDSDLFAKVDSGSTECLNELKSLKVKKNLGSEIKGFSNYTQYGYIVSYEQGDICDYDTNQRYSSEIAYVCADGSDEVGWPDFIGTNTKDKCHYKF